MAEMDSAVSAAAELELQQMKDGVPTDVVVRGRVYRVGWLRNATLEKLSSIIVREGDDRKVAAMCAAAIVLNGYWSLLLWWWVLWRWYYYVRQYTDDELYPIIDEGKKKVPAVPYFRLTMSLTELRTTVAQMTREEVNNALKRFRAEQDGDSPSD